MSNITAIHLMLARQDDPLTDLTRRALHLINQHEANVNYYLQSPEMLERTVREAVTQQIAGEADSGSVNAVLHLLWQEKQGLLPEVTASSQTGEAVRILAQALNLPEQTGLTELARAAAQRITAREQDATSQPSTSQPTASQPTNPQSEEKDRPAPPPFHPTDPAHGSDQVTEPRAEGVPPVKMIAQAGETPPEAERQTKRKKGTPEEQTVEQEAAQSGTAQSSEAVQSTEETDPLDQDAWKWLTQEQILAGREQLKADRSLSTQQRAAVRHAASRAATLHVGSDALERANANEQLGLTLIAQVIRPTRPEARGPSPEEQLTEAIKQARLSYGTMPYTLTGLTGLAREANDRLALGLPETVIKRAARDEINDATMKQVIHNNGKGYYTNIN